MDDNKINKDFNSLIKFRLSIFIIVIVLMVIIAPLYWIYIFNKKRKARPIINNNTVTGAPGNAGVGFLSAGEVDNNQADNGYSFSSLGQPCINSSTTGGLPNLPGVFTPQPCDTNKGLKCTEGILEGAICLSQLGFTCDSVNDCTPDADACLNNICSRQSDTLNQLCKNDNDCQIMIDTNVENSQPQIYNHVCQKERNHLHGYCKVNSFPYDTGCNTDSECVTGAICSNSIGKFAIGVSQLTSPVSEFGFADDIALQNLNNLIANVFDGNDNLVGIYQVIEFNTVTMIGNLTPSSTTGKQLTSGIYNISFGQANKGICLEKIPEGGPANLTLGGIDIPCEDGLKNIKNFCLKPKSPQIGDVCVRDIVTCPSQSISSDIKIDTSCLYDDNTEQTILNDYYFNISPNSFAEYKIGNCVVPTVGKGSLCDNAWNGCSGPYICMQEPNQNGTPVSICTVPFQAQICFNDQCPENYICGNSDARPPTCVGKTGAFCIENDDCKSNHCSNNYSIKVFDPDSGKIIGTDNKITVTLNVTTPKLNLYQPSVKSSTFPNSEKLAVAGIRLFWYKLRTDPSDNYILFSVVIIDENNNSKTVNINMPLEYEIKDIIRDEDNNFLILYKRPVNDTMRERIFPIISYTKINDFVLPDYNGLTDGIKVYYINKGGPPDVVDPGILYTLRKTDTKANSGFYLEDSDGNKVKLKQASGNHFIVTYDNKYAIQRNLGGTARPYPLLPSYDFTGTLATEQLSAGDLIYYKKAGTGDTSFFGTTITGEGGNSRGTRGTTLENNTPYYIMPVGTGLNGDSGTLSEDLLFVDGVTPEEFLDYIITDGYYHSVGGYPILDNYKVVNQYLHSTYSSPDYFILNSQGFYTYGITSFDPDNYEDKGELIFSDDHDYIYDENININEYSINGINQGITYVYNSLDDDVKINSKKIDGKNYLIINKGLCYAPEYDNSKYINQFIQLEYDIQRDNITDKVSYYNKNTNFDNTLITTAGTSRSIVSFSIVKNIAQNQSKGFYHSNVTKGENNIDYVNINNNDSIFYTLINNNDLGNTSENSLAINSKYEKINYVPSPGSNPLPEVEYSDFSNFEKLKPLPFSSLVNVNKRKPGENYFIEEKNYIYIYNQTDIDNILNFSSSELVLTKEAPQGTYKVPASDVDALSVNITGQITWCLINIVDYEVNLDTEYLKIKIQVPIQYNELSDIIESKSPWYLHVYNFVSLDYFCIYDTLSAIKTKAGYSYQISDASLLFTGSKGTYYYATENNNISRTGYNNIMLRTAGKNAGQANKLPSPGINYSIYKVTDGAGVYITGNNVSPTEPSEMFADPANLNPESKDFYKMNSSISYIDINYHNTSVENVDVINPAFVPYNTVLPWRNISVDGCDTQTTPAVPCHSAYYVKVGGSKDLDRFNSFSNGRFFVPFTPITYTQLDWIAHMNVFGKVGSSKYIPRAETLPLQDNGTSVRTNGAFQPKFYFNNKTTGSEDNSFSQFVLDSNNSYTYNEDHSTAKLRKIYSGAIRLQYRNYKDKIYAVNDLFASSLPLGDHFFINSSPIKRDNIIANVGYDKDGNVIIKNLGNIPLHQTHMAHYQTGVTGVEADYFNQTNQVAIKFPKWLKARFVNRNSEIPKIRKVIINSNDGNNYANATYYAFIEYGGNTSLVYLDAENNNYDLAENQGIPTSQSIFNDGDNVKIAEPGFAMTGTDRLLYMLSKDCH